MEVETVSHAIKDVQVEDHRHSQIDNYIMIIRSDLCVGHHVVSVGVCDDSNDNQYQGSIVYQPTKEVIGQRMRVQLPYPTMPSSASGIRSMGMIV